MRIKGALREIVRGPEDVRYEEFDSHLTQRRRGAEKRSLCASASLREINLLLFLADAGEFLGEVLVRIAEARRRAVATALQCVGVLHRRINLELFDPVQRRLAVKKISLLRLVFPSRNLGAQPLLGIYFRADEVRPLLVVPLHRFLDASLFPLECLKLQLAGLLAVLEVCEHRVSVLAPDCFAFALAALEDLAFLVGLLALALGLLLGLRAFLAFAFFLALGGLGAGGFLFLAFLRVVRPLPLADL